MRSWMGRISTLAAVIGGMGGGTASRGQCPDAWSARGGQYLPDDYEVRAMVSWNDGRRDNLIVGGDFGAIGAVRAPGIAAWNGQDWQPLGPPGNPGTDYITEALTVFNGDLIASATVPDADGNPVSGIVLWDGSTWRRMGDIAVYQADFGTLDGQLIVGGDIAISGNAASCVRWNGSDWEPLGPQIPFSEVLAVAGYDGAVYAAGWQYFTQSEVPFIFRLEGGVWQPLPYSQDYSIIDFEEFDGSLVATGGAYTDSFPNQSAVIRWTGTSWEPLGAPVAAIPSGLARYGDDLVVVGYVQGTEGRDVSGVVARYDGTEWSIPQGDACCLALAATEFADRLVVGGPFGAADGVQYIGSTDFAAWTALGTRTNNRVADLANFAGQVIAGGEFSMIEAVPARGLAAWDGREWREFAGGLPGTASALRVESDELIVSGQFEIPGVAGARNIAIWHDGTWRALGTGLSGPGDAMARFNGDLVVGGQFLNAGSQTANFVARWDGAAWHALGSGLSGQATSLAELNGELYVGGFFGRAGERLVSNLARWDGVRWEAVGVGAAEGVAGGGSSSDGIGVYALANYGGQLFVGGTFATAGGIGSANLARWDGADWQVGPAANGSVRGLSVIDGVLHVGGRFTGIAGVYAAGAATWDGAQWAQIGESGLATTAHAFVKRGNRLMAAASLYLTNNSAEPAAFTVAEFGCIDGIADLNCDALLTLDDIRPFVLALTDPTAFAAAYPGCTLDNADANGDGFVNVGDIGAFVSLLVD